ncbi:cation:proton antiporter domain-containing protein [Anderseniella sp. Alg231-50]|uniref:cation:proton antiporter domain-containing protein n=1 Tax=Anderseniella sp. Alg231-50 TaxID=1922226 RepID=UPI000D560DCD
MTAALLIIAIVTACYTILAKRLASTPLTAPMLFIAFGALMSVSGLFKADQAEHILHFTAEIALILLLFLDASQIDLKVLRRDHGWPIRMLLTGLPLSVLIGSVFAWLLLPGWPVAAVVLMAALLAPTDAALGQAVVSNTIVPDRVRRTLTVESGLNDGLALPLVLLFASLLSAEVSQDGTYWLVFAAAQLILGPIAGIVMGWLGGRVLLWSKAKNYTSEVYEGVGAIALAIATYLLANQIGGNGFIAAFVGGLTFGNVVKGQCKFIYEFTESEGQMLSWGAFFLLGLVLVPTAVNHLDAAGLAVILTSLFIVRPLAVWMSLARTDTSAMTRLFLGWFGPRGLATALFALLVAQQNGPEAAEPILMLAINAVWISALLHGVTAAPAAKWYARKLGKVTDCAETQPIHSSAKPLRTHQPPNVN